MKLGELVRGVIYDIDNEEEVYEVVDELHYSETEEFDKVVHGMALKYPRASLEQHRNHLTNANAILSLIGADCNCDTTSNMIIPKKALSKELVNSLSPIDISKDILEKYRDSFTWACVKEPSHGCKSEFKHEPIHSQCDILSMFDELDRKYPDGLKVKIKRTPEATIIDSNQKLNDQDITILRSILGGICI